MGAVVGALYVIGSDIYFLEKYAQSFNTVKFFGFAVHTGELMKGKKIQQLIILLAKNLNPFVCSAIYIMNSKVDVFKSGLIHHAVRASISIPGIFAPYDYHGTTYIDGSVLDRIPVQAARDLGTEIVAVDMAFRSVRVKIETLKTTLELCDWHNANRIPQDVDMLILAQIGEVNPYSLKEMPEIVKKERGSCRAGRFPNTGAVIADENG